MFWTSAEEPDDDEVDKVYMKLKAYEDTGLTPEEVEKMRDEHRWIPVTERLPETREYRTTFLATVSCEFWKNNKTLVVEWENTTIRGKDASRWIWNDRLFPKEWEIIAWQPLPATHRPAPEQDKSSGKQEHMTSVFLRDSRL